MTRWLRCEAGGAQYIGTLENDTVTLWTGELFADPQPTGRTCPLTAVRVLPPCQPAKLIGLWNNFHERAVQEGLQRPAHPPYFIKAANCYAAHGDAIRRPAGYAGMVVFEAELGIVIGRRATAVSVQEATAAIFGYTCVNDVTARDLMRLDPAFVHWTRAKSFDSFGPFGPVIATGIEPDARSVRTLVNGKELQNYPVADMFFRPRAIVSRLSQDMTLMPGDIIACGTSLGAGAIQEGDLVEIEIEGVGRLANRFG